MISFLRGKIKLIREEFIILDVAGTGYRVFVAPKTIKDIKNIKGDAEIYTYQHVREDSLELFGFTTFEELEFFEIITSVSGVGPRVGMAVLEISSIDDIKKAISTSNVDFLTRVPGIGRKKAELIILELKSKMNVVAGGKMLAADEEDSDAVNALVRLGYSKQEARAALESVPADAKDMKEKIKIALKHIGKK